MNEEKCQQAWDILHKLGCDLEHILRETDSKHDHAYGTSKHLLDIAFKHIVEQIKKTKELLTEGDD
jgi:hypothetical protein